MRVWGAGRVENMEGHGPGAVGDAFPPAHLPPPGPSHSQWPNAGTRLHGATSPSQGVSEPKGLQRGPSPGSDSCPPYPIIPSSPADPVRPIDPAAWLSHTAVLSGALPRYGTSLCSSAVTRSSSSSLTSSVPGGPRKWQPRQEGPGPRQRHPGLHAPLLPGHGGGCVCQALSSEPG